ncbi:riboflavin biosynthesis protein RibF [Suttonella sp. R2A3]|uniref:riboflavin biosynthesis protein RibF n=1 Tax=Suttonella sp. R2A3 TaxID=2908648 RepID=UPI001F014C62|nr:riboflavin biosynthesis protein RibF [Suttonella sp. R2A3]UJF24943.1 riboflavin biosynthesis protein RibF [Suttonella sp. R2A3]
MLHIHRRYPRLTLPSAPALAIGNFDGVHLGHQAVIAALHARAETLGLTPMLMSFFPHPRAVINKKEPPLITPLRDRAHWLAHYGVTHWTLRSFTQALRQSSPEDFVQEYLLADLGVKHLLVGDDFRFGYRGRGDFALLQAMADKGGYTVESMDSVCTTDGERISSSAIREAVDRHNLTRARALLGHGLTYTGRVRHGAKRGRSMNTPTANIHVPNAWCLPDGVYVVKIQVLSAAQSVWGVANLGVAPTFAGQQRKLEVHAFSPLGEVYGALLRVEMVEFLREERCFADSTTLQAQIKQDIAHAQALIAQYQH